MISNTSPQDGDTITATTGDWINGPTAFAYQWQTASSPSGTWSDITGATSASYTVSGCQQYLRVRVRATNTDGTGEQFSLATNQVSCVGPIPGTATITGTEQVGQTLTGSTSGWTGSAPITYSYAWYVSTDSTCATYSGTPYTTGTTYSLPVSTPPWNRCIKLVVTATGPDDSTDTAETVTDNIDGIAPSFEENPVVSGIRRLGETLFVLDNGDINWGWPVGGQDIDYVWEQNCPNRTDTPTGWVPYQPNGGGSPTETGSTYTLQTYNRVPASGTNTAYNFPGDINCDVRVEVEATNGNDPDRALSVGDNAFDDSNARGRIQRQFGNTYQVETAASFEEGADPGHWGQAPNLTDPTKPINDCLGPYNWNDDTVTAPYVPTDAATTNAQEACRQLQEAVNQNLDYTENGVSPVGQQFSFTTSPGGQLVQMPAQSQRDGFTKIAVGPSLDGPIPPEPLDGDVGFQGGALVEDFTNLLIQGAGPDVTPGESTTITGTVDTEADPDVNGAVLCDGGAGPFVDEDNHSLICIQDTDNSGRATNVTVRDMNLNGANASQNPGDLNQTYTAVTYNNASGNVQNTRIYGFNAPTDVGDFGAIGQGVAAYRDDDDCDDPDKVTVAGTSFQNIGAGGYGRAVYGTGADDFCSNLVLRVEHGGIDGFGGGTDEGIVAEFDTRLRVLDMFIQNVSDAGVRMSDFTYNSLVKDSELVSNGAAIVSYDQVDPDVGDTVDEARGIEITGNTITDAELGIDANDGVYSITENQTEETYLAMAVGPTDFEEGGESTGSFDEVQAELIGNNISDFIFGVISTNDGIPGALDLTLTGNRIVSNPAGFTPTVGGDDVGAAAGSYPGGAGLLNYYDPDWDPYVNDGDPPAGNMQADPVDARNNWWGCSTGPTYNPTGEQLDSLDEFGYCNQEGNAGEVILDGGLFENPVSGGNNVTYNPWVDIDTDAGDKILRAQASYVDGDPIGETAEFSVDMSENSNEVKLQGDRIIPEVEIEYTLEDSTEVTDAELDRSSSSTSPVTAIAKNFVTAGYETGELPVTLLADYELMSGADIPGANQESDLLFEVIRPDPSLFSGAGSPPSEIGQPGDFWFDTENYCLYGPKVAVGEWPEDCESLWGGTVLSGSGAPSNAIGNPGDFYLDTSANPPCLYGPRGANAWSSDCIPVGGYPLITANRLKSSIKVRKSGQLLKLVRVRCPSGQVGCRIDSAKASFQARQNRRGTVVNARLSRRTIPAGQTAIVSAKVPRAVFRKLGRGRIGSVTVSTKAVGAGVKVELDRRISLGR